MLVLLVVLVVMVVIGGAGLLDVVVCTVFDVDVVCTAVVDVVATAMGVPVAFTSVCASLSLEVMLITYFWPGTTT